MNSRILFLTEKDRLFLIDSFLIIFFLILMFNLRFFKSMMNENIKLFLFLSRDLIINFFIFSATLIVINEWLNLKFFWI